MRRAGALVLSAASAVLVAGSASAQVVVNPASGRVSIRASGQTVASLLDQLARQTGMTVEYEKAPPRQSVSLTVDDRTPAQAIVALLDGLNIPYALSLTADGSKVQTLVLADASAPPKAARTRVGRETSMTPPDEPIEVHPPDASGQEPAEPEAEAPQTEAPQRRGQPPPPPTPATLPTAFPNSPFEPPESKTDRGQRKRDLPPQETPPPVPQAEKEPDV
jgi:hypothetical protein